jgi:uncharacterized protein (DUF305 family)
MDQGGFAMSNRRRPVVAVAVVAAVVSLGGLAACGDDSHSAGATTQTTTAAMTQLGVNGADVTFAQMMIPHHEQAIEMSELALDPNAGAGPAVTALARTVKGAQDPEIATMKRWLTTWGAPTAPPADDHDMSAMPGMMSASQMTALGAARGTAFDRMWLEMMIRHHEGAIAMADEVLAGGTNAEVKALAAQVVAGQRAEIDEMRRLLAAG